jgi:hypothetical protein
MGRLRPLLTFKLGVWTGVLAAGAFMRRAVPSSGDEESDEVALVAIFDGIQLKSRAKSFKGGTMLSWFGGIAVDLREAELAPGARLSVRTLFGGIAVKTPPTWRIESDVKGLMGGIDAQSPAQDDPDAPVLAVDGLAVFGGVAIGAKAGPSGTHESSEMDAGSSPPGE